MTPAPLSSPLSSSPPLYVTLAGRVVLPSQKSHIEKDIEAAKALLLKMTGAAK